MYAFYTDYASRYISGKQVHMCMYIEREREREVYGLCVCVCTFRYIQPPNVPRFGSVYVVNANGNTHCWVLILIHGLRLPS